MRKSISHKFTCKVQYALKRVLQSISQWIFNVVSTRGSCDCSFVLSVYPQIYDHRAARNSDSYPGAAVLVVRWGPLPVSRMEVTPAPHDRLYEPPSFIESSIFLEEFLGYLVRARKMPGVWRIDEFALNISGPWSTTAYRQLGIPVRIVFQASGW